MNPYFPSFLPQLLLDGTARRAALSAKLRQSLAEARSPEDAVAAASALTREPARRLQKRAPRTGRPAA